jgi:hypothetical protein
VTPLMLAEALAGRSSIDSGAWAELEPPRTEVAGRGLAAGQGSRSCPKICLLLEETLQRISEHGFELELASPTACLQPVN